MIDPEGRQVGVLPIAEALKLAQDSDLDLVEVSPNAQPPVCRVMDFGKFKYEQSKKAHASKKKQVFIQVKEVKIRPRTEEHDYQVKLRRAKQFLGSGHKVKVSIMFRGREMAHPDRGRQVLERVWEDVKELASQELAPKMEGRNMLMVLAPKS